MARAGVVVFAPAPELTVTLEHVEGHDEIHLHPGGQGFWIARLLRVLDVDTTLCGSFGGETGRVVRRLIEDLRIRVIAVEVPGSNGGYVHDRRDGERHPVGTQEPTPLSRHELDDLYSVTLAAGLAGAVCVLGGPNPIAPPVPTELYRRLAHDLRTNGSTVVADLSGEQRDAVLDAGVDVLRTSDEDLAADGLLTEHADERAVADAMRALATSGRGARHVIVTRGAMPALALVDGELLKAVGPEVDAVDPTGAGDSVTAGVAAALTAGQDVQAALRLGTAAATLNVTRHGLASGQRDAIMALGGNVRIEPVVAPRGAR